MTRQANHRYLGRRVIWGFIVLLIPGLIVWADRHGGGSAPIEVSCAIAASRSSEPAADILIFGSSRTGTAVGPRVIEASLNAREGTAPITVNRLNITGADIVSSYTMLSRYIKSRGKPQVLIAEVMLSLKLRQRKPFRGIFGNRHFALLPYHDLVQIRGLVRSDSGVESARIKLGYAFKRAEALVYNLFRDPLGRHWNSAYCTEADRTRDGVWSHGEKTTVLAPAQETELARRALAELPRQTNNKSWKWGVEGLEAADYDVHASDRQLAIRLHRELFSLARENDIEVVLLPLTNYKSYVLDSDRAFFQQLGSNVHWYDVYADVGQPLLEPQWRDPFHVHLNASPLVSALVAAKVAPLIEP